MTALAGALLLANLLVLGVVLFTFLLFEVAFPPEARAARELGKGATEEQIRERIRLRGWDRPLALNFRAEELAPRGSPAGLAAWTFAATRALTSRSTALRIVGMENPSARRVYLICLPTCPAIPERTASRQ